MMGVKHEFGRDHPLKFQLHFERRVARRQPGSIADAKYMRIHCNGALAESHVEHDIGGLAARSGQ